MRNWLFIIVSLTFFHTGLTSCSKSEPDVQIKEYLEKAVKYAEKKDLGGLKKLIAKDYNDKRGLRREDLLRIAAGQFFRQPRIFISTKTLQLTFTDDDHKAELIVLAAISKNPLNENDIELLQAEVHRFSLQLSRNGADWMLSSLKWQRENLDKFLSAE